MLLGEFHDARDQVSESVHEIALIRIGKSLLCESRILKRAHMPQECVAHRVGPVFLYECYWVYDIPERFRHLCPAGRDKTVNENLFGKRKTCRKEHGLPHSGLLAQIVF